MWQLDLARGARRLEDLCARGVLSSGERARLQEVEARFRFRVSDYYLGLVDWANPRCPIRAQAIPDAAELRVLPGELEDPIGDRAHRKPPVVVHRYPDRALLFPTLECPMFCRYCFRKVYLADEDPVRLSADVDAAIAYLEQQPGIREVILSGGDPLMLSTRKLDSLLRRLQAIPHLRRLRVHSRVPATLPSRVDEALALALASHDALALAAHFNHPRELTPVAVRGLRRLRRAGIPLAAQTVLLRGVNDDPEVLKALFEGLLDAGVRPYYLHHPDLTVGTQHFRVSIDRGLAIFRDLRGQTSGMALPEYVLEVPGGLGKVPVDSAWVQKTDEPGCWRLRSPFGPEVDYRDLAAEW